MFVRSPVYYRMDGSNMDTLEYTPLKAENMTLRDYFAGQVIGGMLDSFAREERMASYAYEVADEMMKAREKRSE